MGHIWVQKPKNPKIFWWVFLHIFFHLQLWVPFFSDETSKSVATAVIALLLFLSQLLSFCLTTMEQNPFLNCLYFVNSNLYIPHIPNYQTPKFQLGVPSSCKIIHALSWASVCTKHQA